MIIKKNMNLAMWLIAFVIPKPKTPAIIATINIINARFNISTSHQYKMTIIGSIRILKNKRNKSNKNYFTP